jgi:glycosyltransferase involved in cell wall biosynthesis
VKPLTVPIWRSASHITAVSEFTRRLAEEAYGRPVETVYNGVNVADCVPGPAEPPPTRRLVFAGRFSVQKNVLTLVDLLHKVRQLDWRMEMLGDGPLHGAVQAKIAELGLASRVNLRGWVTPEQVERVLAESDVLLLPSLSEGLSVVGIRALAFGLAVVASDVGGNLDLVEQGVNGFLCPVADLGNFADRLGRLLTDSDLLAGFKRASRQRAKIFELDGIVTRFEAIFASVSKAQRHVRRHAA